ncbi:hypothetical protein VIBNISOn1_p0029 [Vibrio nigripulchritudo SOn1]|uniref:Uncharacterized protein n=1 Tax=Vibrio nigripulchritudo SOn1 TaxID=1238450 RepID=A0AAV2VZU8_9VIBR|nr:hypothetical protein [Vibrio nigripulchritudo]CCO50192.1 hypothetical protein VIBNISOn1_p0029 [Vibrio nigripulchritudo SOn1]
MCSWESFSSFTREPEKRTVGIDARIPVDGSIYKVSPDLTGEKVILWWGPFDDELYVEHDGQRYGAYFPVKGPIFYDVSGDNDYKVPKVGEKRERDIQELIKVSKKPVVLFCDEAMTCITVR